MICETKSSSSSLKQPFPFPELTPHTGWAFQPQHRDFVSMCWTEKWPHYYLNSATFNLGNFKWIHLKSLLWENFKSSRGLSLFIRCGDNTYFLRPLWRLSDITCLKIFECDACCVLIVTVIKIIGVGDGRPGSQESLTWGSYINHITFLCLKVGMMISNFFLIWWL